MATKGSCFIGSGRLPKFLVLAILGTGCATHYTPPSTSQRLALKDAWRTTYEENSIQSYDWFIQEYGESNSEYSNIRYWSERDRLLSVARERMLEVRTWERAGKDIRLLNEFLEEYPDSKHAAEANMLIGDLSTLSSEEIESIVENGEISFARDHYFGTRRLYDAGFHIKCSSGSAPVRFVYEYDKQRLGAGYKVPGSNDVVYGLSGAAASVFFEIHLDEEPVFAVYGEKRINPEPRIGANANAESIDRVGSRNASEIWWELIRPVNQAIDKLANSKRESLLEYLDNVDAEDMEFLEDRAYVSALKRYDITELCRWGAFLTATDGDFTFRGNAVSLDEETGSKLLEICGGHYRGMPYSYELRVSEREIAKLRNNGLVVGPYGNCARN